MTPTGAAPSSVDLPPPLLSRLAVALLGVSSVLSLLAWVYEVAPFQTFFVAVSLPLTATLVAVGVMAARRPAMGWWREAMVAGALGGFLGTLGYDLFRLPFMVAGFQVFAPIDSYGVLLLDADSSSAWTGLAGWSYHFLNGISFGVTYAVVAKGRHWAFGIAWALVLETATIITPFADSYALRGQWVPISIAYAAHVPYGAAIGLTVQRAQNVSREAVAVARAPVVVMVVALAIALTVWLRPWREDTYVTAGTEVAPGASALISRREFVPRWLRVSRGECAIVRNDSETTYGFSTGSSEIVRPGETAELCVDDGIVHRVRLTVDGRQVGHSGGFLITDSKP